MAGSQAQYYAEFQPGRDIEDRRLSELSEKIAGFVRKYNEFVDAVFSGNDVELLSMNAVYLGSKASDGTWKIVRSGNDLQMLRRESGSYVLKSTISA
jgi:hypothetical protein